MYLSKLTKKQLHDLSLLAISDKELYGYNDFSVEDILLSHYDNLGNVVRYLFINNRTKKTYSFVISSIDGLSICTENGPMHVHQAFYVHSLILNTCLTPPTGNFCRGGALR